MIIAKYKDSKRLQTHKGEFHNEIIYFLSIGAKVEKPAQAVGATFRSVNHSELKMPQAPLITIHLNAGATTNSLLPGV